MFIAILVWAIVVVFSFIFGTYLCYKVEKHGIERWGATGSLFRYEKRRVNK